MSRPPPAIVTSGLSATDVAKGTAPPPGKASPVTSSQRVPKRSTEGPEPMATAGTVAEPAASSICTPSSNRPPCTGLACGSQVWPPSAERHTWGRHSLPPAARMPAPSTVSDLMVMSFAPSLRPSCTGSGLPALPVQVRASGDVHDTATPMPPSPSA